MSRSETITGLGAALVRDPSPFAPTLSLVTIDQDVLYLFNAMKAAGMIRIDRRTEEFMNGRAGEPIAPFEAA